MSILLVIPNRNLEKLIAKLQNLLPNTAIEVWPNVKEPQGVEYIVAWQPPKGSLAPYTNCKAIASFGAGVDSILQYDGLPDVPITRIVDENLAKDMSRYVLTHILAYQHHLGTYFTQQKQSEWKPRRALSGNKVTILGAGQLGSACANLLHINGFDVSVWSRTKKSLSNIQCYGSDQLTDAIQDADYIVCLLPATKETTHFINHDFLAKAKEGVVLINVARGNIVEELSLLKALSMNHVAHAILDVFSVEPLPKTHAYWQHACVTITPHCSALSNVDTVTQQLCDNYLRLMQNQPLLNVVNKDLGY
ncbi:2-hydroxyacid dehydrogenase [Pseudoalteromonas sp.]|uniref:2-hydroxyacid dehydrogenase n=1 Tax=Pseudoalteromonas sp. TaxID=53249 RepID=UPI00356B1B6C